MGLDKPTIAVTCVVLLISTIAAVYFLKKKKCLFFCSAKVNKFSSFGVRIHFWNFFAQPPVTFALQNPVTLVDEETKYALPLAEKIEVSHDTRKFRFRLPSEKHVLGLPVGQHVYLSAKVGFSFFFLRFQFMVMVLVYGKACIHGFDMESIL